MMGWMMDEYSKLTGQYVPGVITGKPVGGGGSLGRTEATGSGVITTVREAMARMGIDGSKTTASIQGFGNVAQYAALGFVEALGGKVVCISCYDRHEKGAVSFAKTDGVDVKFLQSITDQYGTVDKAKAKAAGYGIEPGDAWIAKDVDVLIPAALEGQITAENVGEISPRVQIIAEGANGPTTPEADEVIRGRGTFLIPDFLCNAGGVTVSYFESVQSDANYYWEHEAVLRRLDQKMTSAFKGVVGMADSRDVYMRDAAYMVAIDRVVKAMELRGWV
jgi:glutamate dehydrogenase (NAD(P)+)